MGKSRSRRLKEATHIREIGDFSYKDNMLLLCLSLQYRILFGK